MRILVLSLLIVMLIVSQACKKKNQSTSYAPYVRVFTDADSLLPTYSNYMRGVEWNAWGVFGAGKIDAHIKDSMGNTLDKRERTWAWADVCKYPDTSKQASGTVSINGMQLGYLPQSANTFEKDDIAAVWQPAGNNNWMAMGFPGTGVINFSTGGSFPLFSGTLPKYISHDSDFVLQFNQTDADSAYVLLDIQRQRMQSNIVSAVNGTAIISSKTIKNRADKYFQGATAVKTCWAFIDVVLIRRQYQSVGGKQYVFVNQGETVREMFVK
ncbi:hypothetical protein [Polluticoccus soli]|uniref:hypothetical protein n=1 Tax=Polluticoccus soli TaxID=3034150 RepID=UPI0023E0F3C9|nr:hypothetical protein [Flavipsychrobacter sp. JY13-12]